jgi:hypothetical protein
LTPARIRGTLTSRRDHALIMLTTQTGLQASELAALTVLMR